MINKLLIIPVLCMTLALSQNRDYPGFEIVVNNNPYPEDIIIHTMSGGDHFMAIIDTALSIKWYINSGSRGMGSPPEVPKWQWRLVLFSDPGIMPPFV